MTHYLTHEGRRVHISIIDSGGKHGKGFLVVNTKRYSIKDRGVKDRTGSKSYITINKWHYNTGSAPLPPSEYGRFRLEPYGPSLIYPDGRDVSLQVIKKGTFDEM